MNEDDLLAFGSTQDDSDPSIIGLPCSWVIIIEKINVNGGPVIATLMKGKNS